MITLHIIETAHERELVKRIFRKALADKKEKKTINSYFDNDIVFHENEDSDLVFGNGFATIYDIHDPEIGEGIVVYDFNEMKVHIADDTAALYDLPSNLFPF